MRYIEKEDLEGKTIKSVDLSGVNVVKITFSDDKVIELWAEPAVYTPQGLFWGIFVEDNPDPNQEVISVDH